MTIEEATKLLKMSDQAIWLKGLEKEQKEAKDMAIKSLEAWELLERPVIGYENIYSVDILGNVRRIDTNNILSPYKTEQGYMVVGLSLDGDCKLYKVHRLVAQAFIPNPQNKKCINHIDGNKENNCVWNLEWCTHKENNIHAGDTGLVTNAMKIKVIETGQVFESLGSCARALGGHEASLSRCIRKGIPYYNFHFEVLEKPHGFIDKHFSEVSK